MDRKSRVIVYGSRENTLELSLHLNEHRCSCGMCAQLFPDVLFLVVPK